MIGISDSAVALYNEKGIDIPAAFAWKREHGTLRGFPGAEEIDAEELLELECDLLAPCALEQVITAENAHRIKASIVCEGANGPVTPEADEILEERGVLVLPDILANAGGVVVSYFEWVQGLQQYFWSEQEVELAPRRDHHARVRRDLAAARCSASCPCGSPPTDWPWSASRTRRPSAASIRRSSRPKSARPATRHSGAGGVAGAP